MFIITTNKKRILHTRTGGQLIIKKHNVYDKESIFELLSF